MRTVVDLANRTDMGGKKKSTIRFMVSWPYHHFVVDLVDIDVETTGDGCVG